MVVMSNTRKIIEKIENDFFWVTKVLNSCKTISHLITAEQLFKNFLKKWDKYLNLTEKIKKERLFREKRNLTKDEIFKNI